MLQANQGRGATIIAILQGAIIIPVLFIMNTLFGPHRCHLVIINC